MRRVSSDIMITMGRNNLRQKSVGTELVVFLTTSRKGVVLNQPNGTLGDWLNYGSTYLEDNTSASPSKSSHP